MHTRHPFEHLKKNLSIQKEHSPGYASMLAEVVRSGLVLRFQAMDSDGDVVVVYFLVVVVLGVFLILNLFVAVLCDSFADRTPPVSAESPEDTDGKKDVRAG